MPKRSSRPTSSATARPAPGRIRRRYHATTPSLVYCFITLLIALGAFNSQNNLLFWAFGLALAVLIVSGVVSGAMLMGVRVEREGVSLSPAGTLVRIRYRVWNTTRLTPAFALTIEEEGLLPPPSPSILAELREMFTGVRAFRIDQRRVGVVRAFVAHVGSGQTIHAEGAGAALRRGVVPLTGIVVRTSFPFGLMQKSLRFEQPGEVVVLPRVVELDPRTAQGASAIGAEGSASRRAGIGDEFYALREYAPGDAPRDVAWRASARRGSLLVRQTVAPSPLRARLVLVLRAHTGSDEIDERIIATAASMLRRLDARGLHVGLEVLLTGTSLPAARGPAHLSRVLLALARLDLGPDDGRGRDAPPLTSAPRATRTIVLHAGPLAANPAFNDATTVDVGSLRDKPDSAATAQIAEAAA